MNRSQRRSEGLIWNPDEDRGFPRRRADEQTSPPNPLSGSRFALTAEAVFGSPGPARGSRRFRATTPGSSGLRINASPEGALRCSAAPSDEDGRDGTRWREWAARAWVPPMNRSVGRIVAVIALVLTLAGGATSAVRGQDATPSGQASDIGVVDAGSRIVWNLNDPMALVYQLTVLQFADAARAGSSFDLITEATGGLLTPTESTPAAVATSVAGLAEASVDVADRAVLYYQPDETGAAGIATLFVLDGVYVHQWAALPVPLQENTLLIDPASLSEALVTLAESWFGSGHEGAAIAQLPGLAQFPAGYEVLSERSGLDSIQPAATPIAAR